MQSSITPRATHLAGRAGRHLPHHLLPAGAPAPPPLELAHVVPVALALLLLGVDAAGVEGGGGAEEGGLAGRGHDERLSGGWKVHGGEWCQKIYRSGAICKCPHHMH